MGVAWSVEWKTSYNSEPAGRQEIHRRPGLGVARTRRGDVGLGGTVRRSRSTQSTRRQLQQYDGFSV